MQRLAGPPGARASGYVEAVYEAPRSTGGLDRVQAAAAGRAIEHRRAAGHQMRLDPRGEALWLTAVVPGGPDRSITLKDKRRVSRGRAREDGGTRDDERQDDTGLHALPFGIWS